MPNTPRPSIDSAHSGDFLRLKRIFQRQTHFGLFFSAVDNPAYRDHLIQQLEQKDLSDQKNTTTTSTKVAHLAVQDDPLDMLRYCEEAAGEGANRLHICMDVDKPMMPLWWEQINVLRERIADAFPHTLIIWLSDSQITTAAHYAPDVWNWRSAVFSFVFKPDEETSKPQLSSPAFDASTNSESASAQARLQEIKNYLKINTGASTAYLLLEAAEIEERLGGLTDALNHAKTASALFEDSNNVQLLAIAKSLIADILNTIGRPNEALTILQDEVLPIFEELGNVYSVAVTKGRVSNILQARGRMDEALAMLQNEVLPIVERFGDTRSIAITKGKIADIFEFFDKFDDALTIRQNNELPVYEQLGDLQATAAVKGKIADIFQSRGRLDEALTMLQNDVLPIFELSGDLRSVAVTKGKIANIFQSRGRLDEALILRVNDELPVFEQLGDLRSAAVTKCHIADIHFDQNRIDQALSIWKNEVLPTFKTLGYANEVKIVESRIAIALKKLLGNS
jgi:tetratricopeptide (TPR) repeat protein